MVSPAALSARLFHLPYSSLWLSATLDPRVCLAMMNTSLSQGQKKSPTRKGLGMPYFIHTFAVLPSILEGAPAA
jgi:hypothetical protein